MNTNSPDISFVILAWNCMNFIEKCLFSIHESLSITNTSCEIIVVDNGSSDGTCEILESLVQKGNLPLQVIYLKKNTGTTYSRNLAFKRATGNYICVMDSDVELRSHVVETLMQRMESDSSVALAVPKLVYPDGKLQKSTDVFPSITRKIYRYFFLKHLEAREAEKKKNIEESKMVDYAISALWVMKADIVRKVGFLDENIFYAPEDVDYCLRIWKAGYKILYDPGVEAIHHTQEISRGFRFNQAFFNHIKGLVYYFHKHNYWFRAPKISSDVMNHKGNSNSMKIIHILNHSFPLLDGYASRSQSILISQKNMGFFPVVLTSPKHEADIGTVCPKQEIINGISFYRTGKNPLESVPVLGDITHIIMVFIALCRLIPKEKPDMIHVHSPVLNALAGFFAAKKFSLPFVYEIRAFWEDAGVDQETYTQGSIKYKLVRFLETWICKKADHVAVLCQGIKQDLISRGISPSKLTPVYNGINPDNFIPCDPDPELEEKWQIKGKKIVGFIGSFYRYEGLDLLVTAFAGMIEKDPNMRLVLVGGGEMEDALKLQVQELGLQEYVVMPGRIAHSRIQSVYAMIHVLVYPRYSVRLTELVTPLKPIEAMAMGKLVVASDIGGHRELISHKETGILFSPGKADSLALAVLDLLANPDMAEKISSHALHYVANHKTWPATTKVYKQIYKNTHP